MAAAALTPDTVSWLLAVISSGTGGRPRLPPDTAPEDPQALLEAITRHGVAGLALRQAARFPALHPLLPPLRHRQADNVAWAFASVSHLAVIAAAFAREDIPWCTLKGIPLALQHYGDLAARRVGDIDLLVPRRQVEAAHEALRTCGWHLAVGTTPIRRRGLIPHGWHEQRYVGRDGMTLELHHRLHPNPHLLDLSTTTLMDGRRELTIGNTRVPVLDPVMELLYLSTHGSRHGWHRLLWVCDIAAIASRASPQLLDTAHREAAKLGVLEPLAQGLLLAEILLGLRAPEWAQIPETHPTRRRRLLGFAKETLWCARDARDNPVQRRQSSLLNALSQRMDPKFWAWEFLLRARHELRYRSASP